MTDQTPDQIECTRCGASVYYELTRCPQCGLNFYQPQDDDWQAEWTEPGPEPTWFSLLLLVLLGWMSAAALTWLFHLLFRQVLQTAAGGFWLGSAGLLVGVALGAWLAAHLAEQNQLLVAGAVGLTSIGTALLFDAFRQDLAEAGVLRWEAVLVWVLLVGSSTLIGMWQQRQALRVDQLLFPTGSERALYEQLLARVRYDAQTVERLIAYESQHQPNGTRLSWLRNALQRWERDNR